LPANLFDSFLGNSKIVAALRQMLTEDRLPQALLFAGPEGVGKATLARFLAAAMHCQGPAPRFGAPCGECPVCRRVLAADLSLPEYQKLLEERAKASAEERREAPLVVSTHPDFLTFPPDGPLAQISIEQVRTIREFAQFPPLEGRRRLFLVDRADRIDTAAANSLLKTLEEPPPYLTLVLTAENAFDLLPTIRSRCVPFYFAPLSVEEMNRFLAGRADISPGDRVKLAAWAQGRPGCALRIDVATYERRREAMLSLLRTASGGPFGELIRYSEGIGRSKSERLSLHLDSLYTLLADLLHIQQGTGRLVNEDIRPELASLARKVDFQWIAKAARQIDELDALERRNIQKQIALEALSVSLRRPGASL
jgi:DNA polymerase-3 subunit delta'